MTLEALLELRGNFLAFDLDDSTGGGSTPTTAQKLTSVNAAIRQIAIHVQQYDPAIPLTLTADQDTYNLRSLSVVTKRVVRPYQVIVNGYPLYNAARTERGLWTLQELERVYPGWRSTDAGTPARAVQIANSKLILHPKPNSTVVSAGENYVSGTYIPPNYSDSDLATEPDLPEELHEAVAYLAAVKSALPFVSEAEGWQRLTAFNGEWAAAADEVRRDNVRLLQSWGSTSGYAWRDSVRF